MRVARSTSEHCRLASADTRVNSLARRGVRRVGEVWLAALTELRNRGVKDIFFLVCDGLKGLPDSVSAVFPQTTCKPV